MKTSTTKPAPPAKPIAKPKAAAPAAAAAPTSIRDRELDKRRKVFKQSFDSPLKVKWGSPAPADLQSELLSLLTTRLFPPSAATPAPAVHRGLQSTFKLLAARICNPLKQLSDEAQAKVPTLAIILFRGDLDNTLSGPDLYGWLPGIAQLAKCAGHVVHMFVVTEVGANLQVASAIQQAVENKVGKVVPRYACIAIELGSDLASTDLAALAARFPTPSVPFYTSASDSSNIATFTQWAKLVDKPSLLSPNIKLLETSAPIVDRKKQKESKTAAKIQLAAKQKADPKPIRPKSGPQRSSKATADKQRQRLAAEFARGGPLVSTEFGHVADKFASPLDKVRAMLKVKVELRESRERHAGVQTNTVDKAVKEPAPDAMDIDPTPETAREVVPEQGKKVKPSKKRSRPSGEPASQTASSVPTAVKSKKRRTNIA
ncbi:hypothetical protein BCR44DRAFT_46919 [Catenaria anguillulae PL171]|uniref:Uncharacterized protein n=1 Tax=Catenaria anguillulae PL171 TaxID=765915 RepID=A0A1Y2H6G3_9FUNG|nr:hypothetical protein BCR44DRAFT_46919 [Catenaria anguillulae PL171]